MGLLAGNKGRSGRLSLLLCQSCLSPLMIVLTDGDSSRQPSSKHLLSGGGKNGSLRFFDFSFKENCFQNVVFWSFPFIKVKYFYVGILEYTLLCLPYQHSLCIKSFHNLNTFNISIGLVSPIHQSIHYLSSLLGRLIIKF